MKTQMKKQLAIAGGLLVSLFACGVNKAYGQATQLPANQAYFMLVNQNSGSCLDLIGGNTANQAVIN